MSSMYRTLQNNYATPSTRTIELNFEGSRNSIESQINEIYRTFRGGKIILTKRRELKLLSDFKKIKQDFIVFWNQRIDRFILLTEIEITEISSRC